MKKKLQTMLSLSLFLAIFSSFGWGDEISDTIEDALASYKQGNISATKEDLSYVLELLRQKRGEQMKAYLPAPLTGWHADKATAQMAGVGMLGGGTTLSRVYTQKRAKIRIEIIADSPLIAGLGSMFSNPILSSGGKLKRINREKAMINYLPNLKSGEITLMIDKRFMVTIKGEGVLEETLISYAQAIDFEGLKKI